MSLVSELWMNYHVIYVMLEDGMDASIHVKSPSALQAPHPGSPHQSEKYSLARVTTRGCLAKGSLASVPLKHRPLALVLCPGGHIIMRSQVCWSKLHPSLSKIHAHKGADDDRPAGTRSGFRVEIGLQSSSSTLSSVIQGDCLLNEVRCLTCRP